MAFVTSRIPIFRIVSLPEVGNESCRSIAGSRTAAGEIGIGLAAAVEPVVEGRVAIAADESTIACFGSVGRSWGVQDERGAYDELGRGELLVGLGRELESADVDAGVESEDGGVVGGVTLVELHDSTLLGMAAEEVALVGEEVGSVGAARGPESEVGVGVHGLEGVEVFAARSGS